MKHLATLTTIAAGAALALATPAYAQTNIKVEVNGKPVQFGTAKPQRVDGRVLVPLRGIFESLNASVLWDGAARTVTAMKGNKEILLFVGQRNAKVDGIDVMLDTPAQIIGGATMVPLRFVSEALGAGVKYEPSTQLVAINLDADAGAENYNNGMDKEVPVPKVIEAFTVLPVSLNQNLSSTASKKDARITAAIDTKGEADYGGIPMGSYLEGRVADVRAKKGDTPGVLELQFDKIRLPDGRAIPIDGSLYSLEADAIERTDDGVMVAKNKKKDNRLVYAGYGAGAGVLVGLLSNGKVSLEKALLGGLIGFVIGSAEKPKQTPSDVKLDRGTLLGVRLNENLVLTQK
jgi:hypothetical protein